MMALAALAAACAPAQQPPPTAAAAGPSALPDDIHIPPFARWPYQPFSREAAVLIALREWRAFGSAVVYPNQELPYDAERTDGLWQRVGEYWWLGLPMSDPDQGFTGMHDQNGRIFPASEDGNYAWSAAFIDYVMRMAGAGHRFPYSSTHSDYINAAKEQALGQIRGLVITAEPPEGYAPQPGDLICGSRTRIPIRYADLPTGRFPGHCDIVVATHPGSLDVIGGNVDNTVAMKHIPVTADGRLARPDGTLVDPDHPWFVVLRVDYDINGPALVSPPVS
jgi:Uncharacterized protein conserved in bacteria (DUF2272)